MSKPRDKVTNDRNRAANNHACSGWLDEKPVEIDPVKVKSFKIGWDTHARYVKAQEPQSSATFPEAEFRVCLEKVLGEWSFTSKKKRDIIFEVAMGLCKHAFFRGQEAKS